VTIWRDQLRKTLAVAAIFLLGADAASAVDIYAGDAGGSLKNTPVYAVNSWSGFYGGTNSGAAWSHHNSNLGVENFELGTLEGTAAAKSSSSGAFNGAQIGYNWQRMNVVFGIEADIDLADIHDKAAVGTFFGATVADGKTKSALDYFGTLRGRLGFTAGRILIYGTGGLAFGGVKDELSAINISGNLAANSVSNSKTAEGWAAGGGIEYALTPAVSLRTEYLHIDLGSTTLNQTASGASYSNASASLTTHHDYDIVRGGVNYRLGENEPFAVAANIFTDFFATGGLKDAPIYAANNWAGFYGGTNSGSAWSQHRGDLAVTAYQSDFVPGTGSATISPTGALGGGEVGYNWQQGRIVVGVEADADWSGVEDKAAAAAGTVPTLFQTSAAVGTAKSELDYLGTFRGRVGYTTGRLLIYGTGGFAFGGVKDQLSITNNSLGSNATNIASVNSTQTATGWVAGAGFEFAVSPSWSLKTEFLYIDLGSTTLSQSASAVPPSFSALANLSVHHDYEILRGGLNYHLATYEPLK
jgi:outer membrane immunogenic protein